ncbi:MAG: protein translocase subunit SecF [Deltaproteobacteria bacterium]|nr:protein translocase subunit SecF [Deltaproteobacteria bacterium]MBW2071982.1 protein translocase subunit SecF [Deltaproteobacteria bacterium]
MEFIKPDVNVNFVGRRRIAFAVSLALIVVGTVALIWRGSSLLGIDFAGGTIVQVRFEEPTTINRIRQGLQQAGLSKSAIQSFGAEGGRVFLIRTEATSSELSSLSSRVQQSLEQLYGKGKAVVERVEMVGPKVGKDLRQKALLAIYYALLFIAIYISGRFELKWMPGLIMAGALILGVYVLRAIGMSIPMLILAALVITLGCCWFLRLTYALGAVVALIHDVMITVGAFALTNKEFDLSVVAALLTIIGYSLNDTIIVFDRIRENLRKAKRMDFAELINQSINQTLSRTILTSGTTIVVVTALFILGGGVIHDFAFALLVGVIVGTYSSIFVASPVLLAFERRGVGRGSRGAKKK